LITGGINRCRSRITTKSINIIQSAEIGREWAAGIEDRRYISHISAVAHLGLTVTDHLGRLTVVTNLVRILAVVAHWIFRISGTWCFFTVVTNRRLSRVITYRLDLTVVAEWINLTVVTEWISFTVVTKWIDLTVVSEWISFTVIAEWICLTVVTKWIDLTVVSEWISFAVIGPRGGDWPPSGEPMSPFSTGPKGNCSGVGGFRILRSWPGRWNRARVWRGG
jgi:hypothetical protein